MMNKILLLSIVVFMMVQAEIKIPEDVVSELAYKEVTVTKERYKKRKEKFYYFNGKEMWYIKKYKPNKPHEKQGSRIVTNKEAKIIKELYQVKRSSFRRIELELNEITHGCDHGFPFIVEIKGANGKKDKFVLKRFTNCYPASAKDIMELLEDLYPYS